MPQVAPDALNYILSENILGVVPVGYATLFGILTDNFHISKEVIYEMMDRNLIIVDSHFNICFLSYDLSGNVASVYKMSRYNHSDIKYSFNNYVTQADVGFGYCSSEAERHNFFENVVVFVSDDDAECVADNRAVALCDKDGARVVLDYFFKLFISILFCP